jgi:hypothetical protein
MSTLELWLAAYTAAAVYMGWRLGRADVRRIHPGLAAGVRIETKCDDGIFEPTKGPPQAGRP